jgi:cell division protein FtsB
MNRPALWLCATLLLASTAFAQTLQQVQPIQAQPAPRVQPQVIEVAPQAQAAEPVQLADKTAQLEAQNKRLRENNQILRAENQALKDRITQMTTRGGSQVRAYCPTKTTSANTAGAESDCAAGGYQCDDVSGLCHASCATSAQCSSGYSCNPCNRRCESNSGPVTQC